MVTDQTQGGSGIGVSGTTGIVVTLLVGAAIGIFNGFLVVRLRLNAFIATLAMLILLRGATVGMTNGRTLFDLPPEFLYLGSAHWAGIPASVWIAGLLFLLFGLVLRYHRLGRAVYADRRQSGGGAGGRHSGRADHLGAVRHRRHPGGLRGPAAHRADRLRGGEPGPGT